MNWVQSDLTDMNSLMGIASIAAELGLLRLCLVPPLWLRLVPPLRLSPRPPLLRRLVPPLWLSPRPVALLSCLRQRARS